jgi:hypothetical protein
MDSLGDAMKLCNYLYNVSLLGLLMRKSLWIEERPEILDEFWIAGWAEGTELSVDFEQCCQHRPSNPFELHEVSVCTIFCILKYKYRYDKEMELNWYPEGSG